MSNEIDNQNGPGDQKQKEASALGAVPSSHLPTAKAAASGLVALQSAVSDAFPTAKDAARNLQQNLSANTN
tara:strand:+ start:262 stop:474 length:213 start_codon:yes stop_codon:yes gene_type:complete